MCIYRFVSGNADIVILYHTAVRRAGMRNILMALISEMSAYKGEQVDTVFIGGGTPTVLSAPLLNKLCAGIRNCFDLQDKLEFTCEANPGTLSEEKLNALLEGGVNRLSIGVQSFNDNELQCIGRIHSAKEAYDTVLRAKQAGFDNISIDLMTALPVSDYGQSEKQP